jgi:hypothetical protein
MPPRFAYWTIILEGKPTAFRAQERDDLLPTFNQLQTKHPDVALMWFKSGKLWPSRDEALAAEKLGRERRKPDWRPGGEHRDPRARFDIPRDERRRRFAERQRRDELDGGPPGGRKGGGPPRTFEPAEGGGQPPPDSGAPAGGDGPARPAFKPREEGDRRPAFKPRDEGDRRPAFKPREEGDRRPALRGPARSAGWW